MTGAFDENALWQKSKIFIDRAVVARDSEDAIGFHIWATVALELLAKTALARIHPTLVADPTHIESLLTAAGHPIGTDLKSVTMKTVVDRLRKVVPEFDKRMSDATVLMANRRNAEIHSGESPLVGLDANTWVPTFWRVVDVLLQTQDRSLSEYLGLAEAERVREVLRNSAELTRQTVLARIDRRRAEMETRYPTGSVERAGAAARSQARPCPSQYIALGDEVEAVECPACGMKGWIIGAVSSEEITGIDEADWQPWHGEWILTTYSSEEFRCPECGFRAEGYEEIKVADLPPEFVREEERQPDYEPDYGNE